MLAALGAIPLGIAGLRHRRMPKSAAVLLIAALPPGLLGAALLGIIGVPEDYFGLPLTLLYGSLGSTRRFLAKIITTTAFAHPRTPRIHSIAPGEFGPSCHPRFSQERRSIISFLQDRQPGWGLDDAIERSC